VKKYKYNSSKRERFYVLCFSVDTVASKKAGRE